jgi:chorismate-pyruvate lyase
VNGLCLRKQSGNLSLSDILEPAAACKRWTVETIEKQSHPVKRKAEENAEENA